MASRSRTQRFSERKGCKTATEVTCAPIWSQGRCLEGLKTDPFQTFEPQAVKFVITKMHSVPLVMPSKFDEMSRQYILRPTAGEIKLDARLVMAFHGFSRLSWGSLSGLPQDLPVQESAAETMEARILSLLLPAPRTGVRTPRRGTKKLGAPRVLTRPRKWMTIDHCHGHII